MLVTAYDGPFFFRDRLHTTSYQRALVQRLLVPYCCLVTCCSVLLAHTAGPGCEERACCLLHAAGGAGRRNVTSDVDCCCCRFPSHDTTTRTLSLLPCATPEGRTAKSMRPRFWSTWCASLSSWVCIKTQVLHRGYNCRLVLLYQQKAIDEKAGLTMISQALGLDSHLRFPSARRGTLLPYSSAAW